MALTLERLILELGFLAQSARERSPLGDGGSEARVLDIAVAVLEQRKWEPITETHKDGRRLALANSATTVLAPPVFGCWDAKHNRWRVEYDGEATILHGGWAFTHQRAA